jgi:peptide deformylase
MKIIVKLFYWFFLITISFACASSKKTNLSRNFGSQQTTAIMKADDTTPMRVFKINNREDSIILRTKSKPVEANPEDPVLQRFVKRLYHTVTDSMSLGVGIAAPQVGVLKNIIWVQRFDKKDFPFEVYLNPKIVQYSKLTQECLEGCLSIPNRRDTLNSRAYAILIEYDKMDSSHATEMVEDFTAVIFQHEIDHLNGILYTDHLAEEMQEAKLE